MRDSFLLIMTPNMSLGKWDKSGFLSRELDIYKKIALQAGLKLVIYSYGRADSVYLNGIAGVNVLEMPKWISPWLPFRVQNILYHLVSPMLFYRYFRSIKIAKTNQYAASHFGLLLKVLFGIPLVVRMGYYHTHLKKTSFMHRLREQIVFSLSSRILVTSTSAQRYIMQQYSVSEDKIMTILNSIDMDIFKPSDVTKEFDALFVGRLEAVKNVALLIQFLQHTAFKVLVIGEGAMSAQIEEIALARTNISWIKRVENRELPNYYNLSKVFILISKYEGNPKSLLEAMACGLACIGTDVSGIKECIKHGWNGVLIDESVEKLDDEISALLADPRSAQQMGKNAAKWIRMGCSMHQNILQEVDFYRPVIA